MRLAYLFEVADDLDGAYATFESDITTAHSEIEELDDLIDDRLKEIYSIKDPDMHNEYVADLREFVQRRREIYNKAMEQRETMLREIDHIEEKLLDLCGRVQEFEEHFPDFPGEDDVDLYCYMSD